MSQDPSPWSRLSYGSEDDEELPQPPAHEFPRLRRLRGPLAWVALFLVVAGILTAAFTHHGSTAPRAAPPTPTPASVTLSGPGQTYAAYATTTLDELLGPAPDACPQGSSCTTVLGLPPAALAALQAAYPGTQVASAETVHDDDNRTTLRWIRAMAGPVEIDVRMIAAGADKDMTMHTGMTEGELVQARGIQGHWQVDVAVLEAPSNHPSDAAALRLARSPGLIQRL